MDSTNTLVSEALEFIKAETQGLTEKKVDTAIKVGAYLLKRFFDDDVATYVRQSQVSSPFNKLLNDDALKALKVSGKTLQNYIRVHLQAQKLPKEAAALELAGRYALLPAYREPDVESEVATEAVKKRWSSRRIQQEVKLRMHAAKAGKKKKKDLPSELAQKTSLLVNAVVDVSKVLDGQVPPVELAWAQQTLLHCADRLDDAAETIDQKLKAAKAAGTYKEDEPWELPVDEVHELLALVMEGYTPEEEAIDPKDTLHALERAGRRMKAALSRDNSPDIMKWVRSFTKDLLAMAPRDGQPWYRIQTFCPSPLDGLTPDTWMDRVGASLFEHRCLVEAPDEDAAVAAFTQAAVPLLRDLPDPFEVRAVEATYKFLVDWRKKYPVEKRFTGKMVGNWMTQSEKARPETLQEYVTRLQEERLTRDAHEKELSP